MSKSFANNVSHKTTHIFFLFSLNRNLPIRILGTWVPKDLTKMQESSLRRHVFHMLHASCLLRKAIREELAIQVSNLFFFLTEHIFLYPDRRFCLLTTISHINITSTTIFLPLHWEWFVFFLWELQE